MGVSVVLHYTLSREFVGPGKDDATRRLSIHRLYPPISYLGSKTSYIIGVHCGTESPMDGCSHSVAKWSKNRVWPMCKMVIMKHIS